MKYYASPGACYSSGTQYLAGTPGAVYTLTGWGRVPFEFNDSLAILNLTLTAVPLLHPAPPGFTLPMQCSNRLGDR
jgi:hypothetical protein